MDFPAYKLLVNSITGGKKLPTAIYIHQDALVDIETELSNFVFGTAKSANLKNKDWDLVKLHKKDLKLSFLAYPDFYTYPYPALNTSCTVDVPTGKIRIANYTKSENPPILHRRETFFINPPIQHDEFVRFTSEGESAGLYEQTRTIGFRKNWHKLITNKGYYLDEAGALLPLASKVPTNVEEQTSKKIERHKTAIKRDNLSTPMFILARKGYLDGDYSILDYGCGNGDDIRELEAHGLSVHGWDPAHRPDGKLVASDIVNLGFVINVIEERSERDEALKSAFGYASKILIVSAMQPRADTLKRFKPYKDGVITKLNTFQKYYTQGELRSYIETTLKKTAVSIAPGVFVIFNDEIEEQKYYLSRQKSHSRWKKLSYRAKPLTRKLSKSKFSEHREIFEGFWRCCLDMGRLPGNDEFEFADELRLVSGSLNKAFNQCLDYFNASEFEEARQERRNDLLVYFALSYFAKRPTYTRMPQSLQRDIKEFFGLYTDARAAGYAQLLRLAETNAIACVCEEAFNSLPAAKLNRGHDFIFHRKYLNQCPPLLRIYVGCAMELYGDIDGVDLVKSHFLSGKVSFMIYDDFKKTKPLLIERVKINLRTQKIDFFDYIPPDYMPVPLEDKEAYVSASNT